MKAPDLFVGKQLFVGTFTPDPKGPIAIGIGPAAIRGAMYCAGPAVFGNATTFIAPEATMMVGRCHNPDTAGLVPSIFKVSSRFNPPTPLDVVVGDLEGPVGILVHSLVQTILNDTVMTITTPILNINANEIHIGTKAEIGAEVKTGARAEVGARTNAGAEVVNAVSADNGLKAVNAILSAPMAIIPVVQGYCTGNKGFDIPHPTQEGKRVRHICVEGPESAIYIRGKLDGSHIIELPEYWKGLVDYDTISVDLTPFGRSDTSLHVKEINEDRIIVSSDHLVQVKCFYQVWVDRLGPELIVEYDGESPADYPGDQSGHSIAGYNYDVREEQ
jgi:hypothetical protein